MFQVVQRPWELIFCIQNIEKSELDDLLKICFN
jgi:hypothetical protein